MKVISSAEKLPEESRVDLAGAIAAGIGGGSGYFRDRCGVSGTEPNGIRKLHNPCYCNISNSCFFSTAILAKLVETNRACLGTDRFLWKRAVRRG